MSRVEKYVLWVCITAGCCLRFVDLTFADLATDEAQFVLGATAAHPKPSLWVFQIAQFIGGSTLLSVRLPVALVGCLIVWLMYVIARRECGKETALRVAALAAIFPSAIVFSRLAYLSTFVIASWLFFTYCFLRARRDSSVFMLILLFFASVIASYTKTQGFVFTFMLLLGCIIQKRQRVFQDPVAIILALSLVPISATLVTSPAILATLTQYSGGAFGAHAPLERLSTLFSSWVLMVPFFLPLLLLSVQRARQLPWSMVLLMCLGMGMAFFLGPSHLYYTADVIYTMFAIGLWMGTLHAYVRLSIVSVLCVTTVFVLQPMHWMQHSYRVPPFSQVPYWNTHASQLESVLHTQTELTILGNNVGHHVRWYLRPEITVIRDPSNYLPVTGTYMILQPTPVPAWLQTNTPLYEDTHVSIFSFTR